MHQVKSRSLLVPLASLLIGLLSAGCPKEMPSNAEVEWQKVESKPREETPEEKAVRARARKNAAEAKVRRMRAAFVANDERACTKDADCSLTPQHCCTCAAGGQLDAVNAEKLPELIKRRNVICEDYVCPQVVSTHESCNATAAVCREGRCAVSTPEGAAAPGGVGVEPIDGAGAPAEGAKAP